MVLELVLVLGMVLGLVLGLEPCFDRFDATKLHNKGGGVISEEKHPKTHKTGYLHDLS